MTCLKYLSTCPCPRCLVLKSKIHKLGMKSDTRDRQKLVRVDSETRRNKVEIARTLIFQKGLVITSNQIKDILDGGSLTLTRVCLLLYLTFFSHFYFFRMPFPSGYIVTALIFIRCSPLISFTSLNLVFGKLHSLTFFGFYMLMGMEKFKNLTNGRILTALLIMSY